MPIKGDSYSLENSLGNSILDTLQKVINRTVKMGQLLHIPGEGGERPFRDWLKSELLVSVLNWPGDKIIIGERFDILLIDEFNRPVATIETKAPYHISTKTEQETFRQRLSLYPSLRVAFFTNGPEWDRLDLISVDGKQKIHNEVSLEISQSDSEDAESFFAPLRADRYSASAKRNRSLITKSQPHILSALAHDLDSIVVDFSDYFVRLHENYEQELAGTNVRKLTRDIFDDWCQLSLQVPVQKVVDVITTILRKKQTQREIFASSLRELGFHPTASSNAADRILATNVEERLNQENIRKAILPLYYDQIKKLSAQSGHVLLARILVYRIGEDMGLFPPLLGGQALETALAKAITSVATEPLPSLNLITTVQRRMVGVLPVVYQLSDLDWWLITDEKKAGMVADTKAFVFTKEQELNQLVTRTLRILDGYDFSQVDSDVWQNVYQNYLPEEERQRIGGFYTPQELVDLILDLAEYKPEKEGLCHCKIIDPACGSGAFINAAAARLLSHLKMPLPCHQDINKSLPDWEIKRKTIDVVLENVTGHLKPATCGQFKSGHFEVVS